MPANIQYQASTWRGGGLPTNYLYDGDDVLGETDASGNSTARYAGSMDVDEPLSELEGTATSYDQGDAIGSVTSLSNGTGAMAGTYAYDSFGKLVMSTGTLINPFQYTAREFDSETGLYEYRARYYDSNIGRFISEDPSEDGNNFYAYAGNSPTYWVDPFGLATAAPDFAESLIPIWGSGKQAVHDFECGDYFWGVINTGLAVSDVFLVKSLATTAGKVGIEGLVKVAGSHSWDATRKWMAREGWRDFAGQQFHHWAIPQNSWGKVVPDVIKNQPWNIMKLTAEEHTALHQAEGVARIWNGVPTWAKVAIGDATGKGANSLRDEGCGCK